jgi:outer membrane protein OmpA-like peptidoglycan-associated protein
MSKLMQGVMGASAALLIGVAALEATAGPGDGAVVVIDQPSTPDLIIQELRAENSDASHVPVKVRMTVPVNLQDGGTSLRSARLTAYLTSTTDADGDRLSEETLQVGPEWANRSVVIDVASPGEGTYFMHVEGELRLEDRTSTTLLSTSTQQVTFGKPLDCKNVQNTAFLVAADDRPCPVLFETGSTVLAPAKNSALTAENRQTLDAAVERIDELCTSGSLHRVSVHGWASTTNSFAPPNEVLARGRADSVVSFLRDQVKGCDLQIHDDSEPGTRAVTDQFDDKPEPNQCAQIEITSHTCVE